MTLAPGICWKSFRKEAVLLPFTAEMVPEVDVAGGRMVIDPGEDFFVVPNRSEETSGE